jgi:hypothetical protein
MVGALVQVVVVFSVHHGDFNETYISNYYGKRSEMAKAIATFETFCQYNGWNDTSTAGTTALDNFINQTLYMLSELAPWPEYYKLGGSAAFTAGTDYKALTAGHTRIGTVIRSTRSTPLEEIDKAEYLRLAKYHAGTGDPDKYCLEKTIDTDGATTITMYVYPNPTADITLYYSYYSPPTSVATWPNTRDWLLYDALKARLAARDRDSGGYALYNAEFMEKVNRAYNQARPSMMPMVARTPEVGKWKLRDIEKVITS